MILALLLSSFVLGQSPAITCADPSSCRQAAIEAAERQDYETFHDLAWRAAQKGRPNDPELMLMLARAQSLSGRPGDALVMLRRLVQLGIVPAVEGDDFRRVRALPGWAELEAVIAALKEKPSAGVSTMNAPKAAPEATVPRVAPAAPADAVRPGGAPAPAPKMSATAKRAAPEGGEEAVRIAATTIDPIGLAYDSASRRFVVGDRRHDKLIVADEVFKRVNDLIGAGSAGFGTLTALEIDRDRGDLWVTSSGSNGDASVHKLQLVSGRVLTRIEVPDDLRPAAIADIALSADGTLLLVDASGGRLLSLAPGKGGFGRPIRLGVTSPDSIAAAVALAYVSHERGLVAADLKSGDVWDVRPADGVALTGLKRIRWHRGSIVAIQASGEASRARLVRIRLARSGRTASTVEVLDEHSPGTGSALTVSGDAAFYLAETEDGSVIRRVPLR